MSLATQVTNPYYDGMTLTGAMLQSEFSTLIAKVNNLDNDNINPSAGIALSKLESLSWTSYTTGWNTTNVDFSIGNGTLIGKYIKLGRIVHGYASLTKGTTTTLGTGSFVINLPVATSVNIVSGTAIGNGLIKISGFAGIYALIVYAYNGSTNVQLVHTTTPVSPIAPAGLGNGDVVGFSFTYESAA